MKLKEDDFYKRFSDEENITKPIKWNIVILVFILALPIILLPEVLKIIYISMILSILAYVLLKVISIKIISSYINKKSLIMHELQDLNKIYTQKFHSVSNDKHDIFMKSKKHFDNVNIDKEAYEVIQLQLYYYNDIIDKINSNRKVFEEYNAKTNEVLINHKNHTQKNKWFKSLEQKAFESEIITPMLNYKLDIYIKYITNIRENTYVKNKAFDLIDIKDIIADILFDNEFKKTYEFHKKSERAKMNDKLRFQVFKRDHYQCKICGTSEKEGAKLHVDHIIPISKGGETTLNNLQTLCESCNLGKGDEYL